MGNPLHLAPLFRKYGVGQLGPFGGHKVHKSVKFCIMAGTAMPRSHRGTGVSPVSDWEVRGTSYRRGEPPIHADSRRFTPMSGTEHRRASAFIGGFKTTALVPFLSLF